MMDSNRRLSGVLGHFRERCSFLFLCWWALIWVSILLSAGFAVQPAAGEPSPAIQFLMREPVTMMDWGLRNLEDFLYRQRDLLVRTDKKLFESEPILTATYDWEQDKIQVAITLGVTAEVQLNSRDLDAIRAHLEWLMKYLRGTLTMKPYDVFFRHRGFRNQDSPQNLGSELAARSELFIRVRDTDANIVSQCRGGLTGHDIYWLTIGNN